MMPTTHEPQFAELEAFAVELAQGAAESLAGRDMAGLAVSSKSTSTDLVTQADRDTEAWLIGQILRRRPSDSVLGEEGGQCQGSSGVRWLIDPIDGTVNFVLGIPQFAVSVAAEVGGTVVAGAVANPASGEVFHAHLGGGARLGERLLRGPRGVELAQAVIGTGFSYRPAVRARQIAVIARLLPDIADMRRMGAASLDLCAVASGRLDGYFEAGLNPWDYAAGILIATEAGCAVTGLRGDPPSPNFVAAAGSSCAADLFALLETLDADHVRD
ncbi:MAG: inositol monophosphatase [Actinomycetota bacterium]|nr:inositol monophosphatase [Actinomycetota bacterium]